MLHQRDKTGKLQLIVAVYVDDVLISGKEEDILRFKITFKQTYKITVQEKLRRHLGIWYKWIANEEGSTIKMHIDDMARK